MELIKHLKQSLYEGTFEYLSHATLFEGTLKGTDLPFRCMFVENSRLTHYLLSRVFNDDPRLVKKNRVYLPNLRKTVASQLPDMCIAVIPRRHESLFDQFASYKGQEWVRQMLDISGSWESVKAGFHHTPKDAARKIRKHGFTYKVSRELEDFELFYHSMFLPIMKKQHGEHANIETFEQMKQFFLKGFLVLVQDGDRTISGALCVEEDDTLIFRRIGVLDGDESLLKKGAQSALYYFIIFHAKECGMKRVDFMKSRSFLADGVFLHKKAWGATVHADIEAESWVYFIIPRHSEKIARFFENNPAIVHTSHGLSCLTGLESAEAMTPELEQKLTDGFFSPGLENLLLLMRDSEVPVSYGFDSPRS